MQELHEQQVDVQGMHHRKASRQHTTCHGGKKQTKKLNKSC